VVNWKSGLVLLAVFVGLAIYIAQGSHRTSPARPAAGLLPCDILETTDLRLTGGSRIVALHRASAAAEWQLTEPRPGPADRAIVDGLLVAAGQLRPKSTYASPPPIDLGLDPARLSVSCSLRSGASYTLSVGSQNFDGSGSYARVSGEVRVLVIPAAEVDRFQRALDQPPYRPSPTPSGLPSPSPTT